MKKIFFTVLTGMVCGAATAQRIRTTIDKAYRDPQRHENGARAESHLHQKTVIVDTVMQQEQLPASVRKKKKSTRKKTS